MLQRLSHLGLTPICPSTCFYSGLAIPKLRILFLPGLWCQPEHSPLPISLYIFESQTTSLPTQSGWSGAQSDSLPIGRTSHHSLSRPFGADPSATQARAFPFSFIELYRIPYTATGISWERGAGVTVVDAMEVKSKNCVSELSHHRLKWLDLYTTASLSHWMWAASGRV